MSINLKVRLFKGKTLADGSHPIQLQFYLRGKLKRKNIYACFADNWDEKKCRVKSKVKNASFINSLISEKYSEYERELIKVLTGDDGGSDFFEEKVQLTLCQVLDMEIKRFQRELKPGTYKRYEGYKRSLATFCNISTTLISEIGVRWFQDYIVHLQSDVIIDGKLISKGNTGSTVLKKVKSLRQLIEKYNKKVLPDEVKALRVEAKKPIKQKLSAAELASIESLDLEEGSTISVVRDLFLLQVYLRGARVGSLLQAYSWQFEHGRYSATSIRGGKNNVGSKLIPKAQAIVDRYIGKHERLFPIYTFTPDAKATEFENKHKSIKRKEAATSTVNKALKAIAIKAGIKKPLSSHIARHTFARMAIDKINNPMVTMELLGHSSLAVHQQYLNDIRKEDVLDQAADDIFG